MRSEHVYAIFSARYAPLTGGVESFTKRLAHELVLRGNKVIVVTSRLNPRASACEKQEDGVEVWRLPTWSFLGSRLPISRRNKEFRQALSKLAEAGVDRVLVNARFYRHSLEGVRFAKRLGIPVVVLDHGSAHLTIGNAVVDWFVERYEHGITARMKELNPSFAGISKMSAEWLRHFGIETDVVIPNAIDVDEFCSVASPRSFRAEFGVGDEQKIVAFVGRLEREKGPFELAQAMSLLGDEYRCLMAGDGSLQTRLKEQAGSNVILLGRIDQPDLSALLRDADIFCLPSRSEGFCTSLLEAAAQNAIPVMPHVGGTDEVMGWDPAVFGVGLEAVDPERLAEGIHSASQPLRNHDQKIKEHVSDRCSWERTIEALDASFSELES